MHFVYVIGAKPRGRWRRPVSAYAILTAEERALNVRLPNTLPDALELHLCLYQAPDPDDTSNARARWDMRWLSSGGGRLHWYHYWHPNQAFLNCDDVPKAREFFAGLRACLEARIAEAYADYPVDEEVYEYDWESARPAAPRLAKRRVRAVRETE